jgi:hypothetical protein
MGSELVIPSPDGAIATTGVFTLPAVIADQGETASERFFTFLTQLCIACPCYLLWHAIILSRPDVSVSCQMPRFPLE